MNNALWVPRGTDVFLTFPLSLPLPTCKGGVGWTWISIKEQAQQQQSLKELTSGWIKYVTEWGSVVNDGVGWDLIPICLFREYLVIITPHPPPQTALWSARAVQPGACKPCCVQPFTGTAHCRAENGPKVTTWFCTFPLKSFNYIPTAGWSPVLASLLTLLSKDFDIEIFFFQRIFSNFSGRKNITSSVKQTRFPVQTCCRRDFWDCAHKSRISLILPPSSLESCSVLVWLPSFRKESVSSPLLTLLKDKTSSENGFEKPPEGRSSGSVSFYFLLSASAHGQRIDFSSWSDRGQSSIIYHELSSLIRANAGLILQPPMAGQCYSPGSWLTMVLTHNRSLTFAKYSSWQP